MCPLLGALAATRPAVAQVDERTSPHVRNDCRLAAQIITLGQPDPHRKWALETINRCGESGGGVIASLWADPPADPTSLDRLYWITAGFLDARVLGAVRSTVANTAGGTLVRLTALRVLGAYVNPHVDASITSLTPPPENPACASLVTARDCVYPRMEMVGSVDHRPQTAGAEPLPSDYRESILRVLQELATADPDRTVRYAAGRLRQRLNP